MHVGNVPLTTRDEWRQHWRVVAGADICVATGYAVFPFVASQFVQPLQANLGWSRGAQSLTQNTSLLASFLAPLVGRLVDRYGVRPIGLFSMVALAIVYGLLGAMRGPIQIYYALMGAAIVFGLGTTGVTFIRAVSTRFNRSLGLALAVTRCGVATSAAILPILIYQAILHFGWRGGYWLLSAVAVLIGIPACVFWIPNRRLTPSTQASLVKWSSLLLNRKIAVLCLAMALTMGPVVGLLTQLQPLLTGKGIIGGTAAMLGSLLAVSVLAGTIATGWLLDRIWAPLIACAFLIASALGCALLLPHSLSPVRAACAVALVGVTQGAELDLAGFVIAKYFGVTDYAAIFGLTILAIGVASAGSQMGYASLFDRYGSYGLPLQLSFAAFVLSGAAFLTLGRYPSR